MRLKGVSRKLKRFKYKVIPGIYFLFKAKKLIYIGQTSNIYERILSHKKGRVGCYHDHDYAYYMECPGLNSFQRGVLEDSLIHIHKPKLNKTIRY